MPVCFVVKGTLVLLEFTMKAENKLLEITLDVSRVYNEADWEKINENSIFG